MLAVLTSGLLLCTGCGTGGVTLPGETPVYTISCDHSLDDCYAGAQTLCGGPYEPASGPASDGRKMAAPGSFGWVDSAGNQHDAGGSSGKYSIRIRCK
jgi:hypothetical protein